jgi:integral membrane sensor domain MASE1
MSTPQTARPSRFMEFITTPWVDKTIAVIAITPNAIELYHRYTDVNLSFVRAVAGIQTMILIITMVFRRTPVRVTPNPWYWLLAFVATYGLLAFVAFAPRGTPIVPIIVPNVLVLISVAIMIMRVWPSAAASVLYRPIAASSPVGRTSLYGTQSTPPGSSRCSPLYCVRFRPLICCSTWSS